MSLCSDSERTGALEQVVVLNFGNPLFNGGLELLENTNAVS